MANEKFNFRFWPPFPDAINGKEFADQIENGINDVGELADDAKNIAEESNGTASNALSVANNALNTSNMALAQAEQAVNTAGNAQQAASQAVSTANAATQTANQALGNSINAVDVSNAASQNASQALTNSQQAIITANDAKSESGTALEQSNYAVAQANEAINIASGYFVTHDEIVDANDEFANSEKYLLTNTENTNFPVEMPVFFEVNIDDNDHYVRQIVTSLDASVYRRVGTIDENSNVIWGDWQQGGGGGDRGLYIGKMEYTGYAPDELPDVLPGWYFMNGDTFSTDSEQGKALMGLPEAFKARWDIAVSDDAINIPSAFYSDGRGYYLRSGDGVTKTIGSVEDDAIRNITGSVSWGAGNPIGTPEGALFGAGNPFSNQWHGSGTTPAGAIKIDASLIVPVADENRVLTQYHTPIIYLGA